MAADAPRLYDGQGPGRSKEIKPVERTCTFTVDPVKGETMNKWRMMEVTDGVAPLFDFIYLPKWLRRSSALRAAMPARMEIKVRIEYCQADPDRRA